MEDELYSRAVRQLLKTAAMFAACAALAGCPKKPPAAADSSPPPDVKVNSGPPLGISDVTFAGAAGHRPTRDFSRGENVVCLFTVSNFTYRDQKAHIRVDVTVEGPGGEVIMKDPDIELIKGKAPSLRPGTIRTAASLTLSPAAPPGKHTVRLTVRDVLGRREGKGTGTFTLLGTPAVAVDSLTLVSLAPAGDSAVPAGSTLPVAFSVKGFATRKKGDAHEIHLTIKGTVEDAAGQPVATHEETLYRRKLLFRPASLPREYVAAVPSTLPPGAHRLALTVVDKIGGGKSTGMVRFKVVPRKLAIFNLHTHDSGGLPRKAFLPGEQIFIRLSVSGLKEKNAEISAAVDLAVAGPDGGIYLAQKDAASTRGKDSRAFVKAGRYPMQLPLVLPAICPTGKYRLVIRARDRLANRTTVREREIQIEGQALPRLGSFKVDGLEVRNRPDLPLLKGDTFGAGREYHLALRIGGGKLEEIKKLKFRAKMKADLRLRIPGGKVVHELKDLFRFERVMTYRPLRILIPAKWMVPRELRTGLYDLEISAFDLQDDHISQFIRRVEVIGAR